MECAGNDTCFTSSLDTEQSGSPNTIFNINVFYEAEKYRVLVLGPILGVVGMVGNIISGIVVVRSGLDKPSNIFLLGLAVADCVCLVWPINVVGMLKYKKIKLPLNYPAWELPYLTAKIYVYINNFLGVVSAYGGRMSTTLTVIITAERLIAVLFPLQFSQIVTPRRAWLTMLFALLFWLPVITVMFLTLDFSYVFNQEFNASYGKMYVSKFGFYYTEIFPDNDDLRDTISHTLPLTMVSVGCIVIAIKVKINQKKRKSLVSSKSSKASSQTTRTLLMVCLIYCISRFSFVLKSLPQIQRANSYWRPFADLYRVLTGDLISLNSSCNFFIYVVFNAKFRRVLKDMMRCSSGATKTKNVASYH